MCRRVASFTRSSPTSFWARAATSGLSNDPLRGRTGAVPRSNRPHVNSGCLTDYDDRQCLYLPISIAGAEPPCDPVAKTPVRCWPTCAGRRDRPLLPHPWSPSAVSCPNPRRKSHRKARFARSGFVQRDYVARSRHIILSSLDGTLAASFQASSVEQCYTVPRRYNHFGRAAAMLRRSR